MGWGVELEWRQSADLRCGGIGVRVDACGTRRPGCGQNWEELRIVTEDKMVLHGYFMKQEKDWTEV